MVRMLEPGREAFAKWHGENGIRSVAMNAHGEIVVGMATGDVIHLEAKPHSGRDQRYYKSN